MMGVDLKRCAINTATLGFQCPIEQSIDAIAAQAAALWDAVAN